MRNKASDRKLRGGFRIGDRALQGDAAPKLSYIPIMTERNIGDA